MLHLLIIVWCLSLAILTLYHLMVFRIRKADRGNDQDQLPGVSIVMAVKNGSDFLVRHVENFLSQDYPLYEIIIVDDHSTPEEKLIIENAVSGRQKISLLHSTRLPGKKQALSLGIESAKYELILCTDADCFPSGPQWIKSMASLSTGNDLVLGYSPYVPSRGILNLFIRFETVMTAIQYCSWALAGRPYMGVGRNMLYPRKLFQQQDPYKNHKHIPYGDDDLWVQQASSAGSVAVNLDKSSFVFSEPARTWGKWFKQKHRHMSAGHFYSKKTWWQPGIYGMALITHWIFLPFVLVSAPGSPLFIFLLIGLAVRLDTYRLWTRRLTDHTTALWYPLLEVGYALYLAGMGLITILAKKKTWN